MLWEERAMELAEQSFSLLGSYALPLWATITAGVFVVVSLSLSLYLLFNHLSAYKNPEVVNCLSVFEISELCLAWVFSLICAASMFFQEQKFLVGVILMVPCYAVESVRCYAAALSFV